nr:MAG TPA: hypothetical protein [Microviridae sp.]
MFALNIEFGYRIAVSIAYFLMVSYCCFGARTDFDVCFEHRIRISNCGFDSVFSYGFLLLFCYGKGTVLS